MSGPPDQRPWWLKTFFGPDVWTIRDASRVERPIGWIRRRDLGTIEQEREYSVWMWRRVMYQSRPELREIAWDFARYAFLIGLVMPPAAFFIGGWGVLVGVSAGFLILVNGRSQQRSVIRAKADGLAQVMIDAKRCPSCMSIITLNDKDSARATCALCACDWLSIDSRFAQKPDAWTVDHRADPCAALMLKRVTPGGEIDESVWTSQEYKEFIRAIKHRHLGAAIAPVAGWVMLVIAAVAVVPLMMGAIQSGVTTVANRLSLLDAILGLALGGMWIYAGIRLTRSFGIDPDTMRKEMLARARCASCGYSLVGVPREADGCTVCPECAAAWRVPDLSARGPAASADLRAEGPEPRRGGGEPVH